jgi:linoleoyl-CoA desaturase
MLQFQKDIGNEFLQTLNERVDEVLKQKGETRFGNAKMYFKIVVGFLAIPLFYLKMITSDSLAMFYVFYTLTAMACIFTALNVAHDATHQALFPKKSWNDFFYMLSFQMIGSSAYVWKVNHIEHHNFPNVEGHDPDVINSPFVRIAPQQQWRWFHRYQHIYIVIPYLIYTFEYFFISETLLLLGLNNNRAAQQPLPKIEVIKALIFKLLYIYFMIFLPYAVLKISFFHCIAAFFILQVMLSIVMILFLGISHLVEDIGHNRPDDAENMNMSWAILQLKATADFDLESRWFNFFLGGFNAHVLHHLLPNLCHIHYLDIAPVFRKTVKDYNLTYIEMPYNQLFISHFKHLKKMGTEKNA